MQPPALPSHSPDSKYFSNSISSNSAKTQFDETLTNNIVSKTISNDNFLQTINARATNYNTTAVNKGLSGEGYKTKSAQIADIEALIADYKSKIDLYSSTSTAIPSPSTSQITNIDMSTSMNQLVGENDFIKIKINNNS